MSILFQFLISQEFTSGPKCGSCVASAFYLSENQDGGCLNCVCMGVSSECSSSNVRLQRVMCFSAHCVQSVKLQHTAFRVLHFCTLHSKCKIKLLYTVFSFLQTVFKLLNSCTCIQSLNSCTLCSKCKIISTAFKVFNSCLLN